MRIEVDRLTVRFRETDACALDSVTLHVTKGEQVALLGPSGSGKTTLLRTLMGAVRPIAGQVRVGGIDPFGRKADIAELRRLASMMRQRDDLVAGLTAQTNAVMSTAAQWRFIDWLGLLFDRVPDRWSDRLEALLRDHGVADCRHARVEYLSGGQRRRVALVRALLPGPQLLLADEPTTGLDPRTAEAAVRALRTVDAVTLVVTTHDLAVARQFDRIVALRDGTVVYDGARLGEHEIEQIYGPEAEAVAR